MIVKSLAPVGGRRSVEQRRQVVSLHLCRYGQTRRFQQCFHEIHIGNRRLALTAGFDFPRPTQQKRGVGRFLEDLPLVKPAVFSERGSLVGRIHHNGVRLQPHFLDVTHQLASPFIHRGHAGQLVVHLALIFPPD
jgi:hypothetical protein